MPWPRVFFASLEKELIHQQRRRRFATRSEAALKIFEYIEGFYNRSRLHSALAFRSPVEFEQAHAERKAA
ncbi:MAG: IS3 family transposase [Gammaproteobacteria bacterium]|nr:IS3 family transposase [Gammaproteobacteria bacterium]